MYAGYHQVHVVVVGVSVQSIDGLVPLESELLEHDAHGLLDLLATRVLALGPGNDIVVDRVGTLGGSERQRGHFRLPPGGIGGDETYCPGVDALLRTHFSWSIWVSVAPGVGDVGHQVGDARDLAAAAARRDFFADHLASASEATREIARRTSASAAAVEAL